jgi:hypothetical protein
MKKVTGLLVAGASLALAHAAGAVPLLNEVVTNDVGTDDREFVEICANPGEVLSAYTLVLIEADSVASRGNIDAVIPLTGPVGLSGLWVVGDAALTPNQLEPAGWIENGAQTILIVQNFTGALNMDIDTNNDWIADVSIGTIIDGVAVGHPSTGVLPYYNVPFIGPDTGDNGQNNFDPSGVVRCQNCTGTWGMICLAGTEPPPTGSACNTSNPFNPYLVTFATPGALNTCGVVAVEPDTWGKVKSQYR